MSFEFGIFGDENLSPAFVEWLVDERWADIQNHFGKFWEYYHNRMEPLSISGAESARPYVQAQEYGLPSRITGVAQFGCRRGLWRQGGRQCAAKRSCDRKRYYVAHQRAGRFSLRQANSNYIQGPGRQQTRRNRSDTKGASMPPTGLLDFFRIWRCSGAYMGLSIAWSGRASKSLITSTNMATLRFWPCHPKRLLTTFSKRFQISRSN